MKLFTVYELLENGTEAAHVYFMGSELANHYYLKQIEKSGYHATIVVEEIETED